MDEHWIYAAATVNQKTIFAAHTDSCHGVQRIIERA